MDTTLDGLLNRRVMIEQPAQGYRVAVDTVLLAAATPAKEGERVLEMGCGVGGVMLCLAARVSGLAITGIDIQEELVALCRKNIERNEFQGSLKALQGDVTSGFSFTDLDHVVMNPPYHDEVQHDVSGDTIKRTANTEKEGDLALWLQSAVKALKPSGVLTLIHRADRLQEILRLMESMYKAIEVLPILTKPNTPAKRVIMHGYKEGMGGIRLCKSILLHKPKGGYTDEVEAILRQGEPLIFISE